MMRIGRQPAESAFGTWRPLRHAIGIQRVALNCTVASALLLLGASAQAVRPAPSDQDAQRAHAQGSCGSLGPGTGLKDGKGWVASMLPGRHEFRVRGGGNVFLTTARQRVGDFDAGRLYYIVVEGAAPDAVLEWKIPGSDWGPVSKYFLYPPSR